jgi:TolB protein
MSLAAILAGAAGAQTTPQPVPQPVPQPANPHGATPGAPTAPPAPPLDWRSLEAPLLRNHVQITSRDKFLKAGEAYFSPNMRWVIFQAVPVPAEGKAPDPFYSMYVAKLVRDGGAGSPDGRITGIEEPILISTPGSANTCGWFNPREPWRVIFGSTVVPPAQQQPAGFQVGTRKYQWQFPEETDVVTRTVRAIYDDFAGLAGVATPGGGGPGPEDERVKPLFSRPRYDAECSWSADGRFVLYTHVRDAPGAGGAEPPKDTPTLADGDIWVYDTQSNKQTELVGAEGYDGGPFFSPDGKWICYRSDRRGDNNLQLFAAELAFGPDGALTGIKRELQLTDNADVNWAPFWHPGGKLLIYGTSAQGHTNYEVYAIEFNPDRPAKELRTRRVTQANGADVLPVFSPDGRYMMWTAQRGPLAKGEERPSSQVWIAEIVPGSMSDPGKFFAAQP